MLTSGLARQRSVERHQFSAAANVTVQVSEPSLETRANMHHVQCHASPHPLHAAGRRPRQLRVALLVLRFVLEY